MQGSARTIQAAERELAERRRQFVGAERLAVSSSPDGWRAAAAVAAMVLLSAFAQGQTGASVSPGTADGLRRLEAARLGGSSAQALELPAEAALIGIPGASVSDGGTMDTWRGRIRGGLRRRFDGFSLGASAEEEWVAYERTGNALPGWPENVRLDRFSLNAGWRPGGDWSFFGTATLSVGSGVGEGRWSEGMSGGGMAFGRCQVTPDFAWLVGLIVYDRLGESVLWLAVPGIDWRVTPRVTIVTAQGLSVNCRLDDEGAWRLTGSVLFDSMVCAVEETGQRAVVRDEQVPVTLGVERRSRDGIRLRAFGGVVAWRRWQLERADGTDETWRGEPSPIFGLEGGRTF